MTKKGFTLVEIMFVVAIIGILVGIAITAGSSAKKVARDNQRKTDIRLLQVKLEAYRGEYRIYPTSLGGTTNSLVFPGPTGAGQPFVSATTLPKDPSTKVDYQYAALQFPGSTCGESYHLGANLENNTASSTPVSTTGLSICNGSFVFTPLITYDVTSPNAF